MRVDVAASSAEFDRKAADAIREAARSRERAAIGLPSGTTPLGMYAELAQQPDGLETTVWFAIDELHGVARDHPATNATYFRRHAPGLAVEVLDSESDDPDAERARFSRLLADAGGLELVVLGIGANGHIAFNEPGSAFDSRARRVALAAETRRQYAAQFASLDETPAHGLTLGIADLLSARRVLLLARGEEKAAAVAAAIEGPLTEELPASALRRHDDVTVLLDGAAASALAGSG